MALTTKRSSMWRGSDRGKRAVIALHVILNEKPISKSELWEAVRSTGEIKTRQTLHVYVRAMVHDGDLQEIRAQGSSRKRYSVSDRFFKHYRAIARNLDEVTEFGDELLRIESKLTSEHYGSHLPSQKRQHLISNALIKAYTLYIPIHLRLLREATFLGGTYAGGLLRLAQTKITDRFLSFAWNLRSNIPNVALFGIANHDVWGWNQVQGLPRVVGSMWKKQKQWEKQFLAEQRESRKNFRALSKSEMSFLAEFRKVDAARAQLEKQLAELRLRLGRDPTAQEFVSKLSEDKFQNPEGVLRSLIAEKWLTESAGLLTQGQTLKWERVFSKKVVRALLFPRQPNARKSSTG